MSVLLEYPGFLNSLVSLLSLIETSGLIQLRGRGADHGAHVAVPGQPVGGQPDRVTCRSGGEASPPYH